MSTDDDTPAYDEISDIEDVRDWSWDALTGGEREEMTDSEAEGYALFAGVPEDEVEAHRQALTALAEGGA